MEKVYVAIGDDLQDGYKTLFWTLNKWNFISIVILHLNHHHISNGLVNSFYGKVPASVMSEEQLLAISLYEQQKTDKLLSKYLTFCAEGKVKAEVLKIDTKGDEPVHKLMIDLISRLRITTLVLATTFMKQSSWRSKSGISGSLKVHQDKPDFCKLYIIRGGKLLSRREENDNKGVIIMRQKTKLKRGLTKTIAQIVGNTHNPSASNMDSTEHEWENCVGELQTCFPLLMSLNLDGKKNDNLEISSNDNLEISSTGSNVPEVVDFDRGNAENMERKIDEARQTIRSNQDEAKFHAERSQNAEFLISLCNRRVEEMESRIRDGIKIRIDLINKHFETEKEQEEETIKSDVKESRTRLNSLLHFQRELSNKLRLSTMAKSHAEAQLEKAVNAQAEMVRQIIELRRQNDILHRRIFCKEKDSTRMVSRQSEVSRGCRAYTAEEIKLATDGFSERHRVKSNGRWTNVYRGRIHQTAVVIKLFNSVSSLSPEAFQAQVERLNNIRHPHFVAMMGFCSEIKCIVYEYMHHGCLEDNLFSSRSNFRRTFRWHDRIRVAHEVCSGLTYFHLAEPRPIVHGNLTPSHILLDRNFVAKISGFGLDQCSNQSDLTSDVKSFGVLLLNLLYGRNWAGLMGKVTSTNGQTALVTALDEVLQEWPLDLAEELSGIAVKCLSTEKNLRIEEVMKDLEVITKKANSLIAEGGLTQWPVIEVPDVFLCPIFQEVMKNPCIAADGFSYESKAIEEWLQMGNDNSPMTKLKLTHKQITPNLTLRSLIQDWHSKRSIPF